MSSMDSKTKEGVMQPKPRGKIDEAWMIFLAIQEIMEAENIPSKMLKVDQLEIILRGYLDDEYRRELSEAQGKYDEKIEEAEGKDPFNPDMSEKMRARYELKMDKWNALMGVVDRAGLKPAKDRTVKI